jgi:hypothetical protein
MCQGNKLGAGGVRRSKVIIFSPSENWQALYGWKILTRSNGHHVPYGAGRCC